LLFSIACSPSHVVTTQSQRGVILAGEEGKKTVGHCTNAYEEGVEGYWVPSQYDVGKMEPLLLKYLETQSDSSRPNYVSYYRQYVGTAKQGKRLIFINGFSAEMAGSTWNTQAVVICGGGSGVVWS
jgi:hypothetical protein